MAALDWDTDHLDTVYAFTQSDVDAEIFVEMPEGFTEEGHALKLNKALEGIKQGAHLWFKRNCAALMSASLTEPSLYIHSELPIMVAIFVNDIIAGYDRASETCTRRRKKSMRKSSRSGGGTLTKCTNLQA